MTYIIFFDGRKYEWVGSLVAVFRGVEKGVKVGDVRVINGKLYYAKTVAKAGIMSCSSVVSWTVPDATIGKILEIKGELLKVL